MLLHACEMLSRYLLGNTRAGLPFIHSEVVIVTEEANPDCSLCHSMYLE